MMMMPILLMSSVTAMDEIVSEVIVRTCRMLPKFHTNLFNFVHLQAFVPYKNYGIMCGSCAEFFIHTLRPCMGDVDFLEVETHSVVFYTNIKPVFPYEVRHKADIIECYLGVPYPDYPSFVRLYHFGELRYNWVNKTYEFIQDNVQYIVITTKFNGGGRSLKVGPANVWGTQAPGGFSFDNVHSLWCPQWPNEAKDWPIRRRNHGWPTTDLIHEVVKNGCHVVAAKHPSCRNDEHQCRLSFSVAEVILLQSWTTTQQIVYHMLRFFAKIELIKKNCPKEDEVLCTYHFKTLMLWSCEAMSPEWWNSSSVIKLCSSIFEAMLNWLTETTCPNYFIPQANLFRKTFNRKIVAETAEKLTCACDSDILSIWFMEHYIQPDFQNMSDCLDYLSRNELQHLIHVISRPTNMVDEATVIDFYVSSRFYAHVDSWCSSVKRGFKQLSGYLDVVEYFFRSTSPYKQKYVDYRGSLKIESCYQTYDSMLNALCAANLLDCSEMTYCSDLFVEVIGGVSMKAKFFISKHHNTPRSVTTCVIRSIHQFRNAQDLMENLAGSNSDTEFQIVSEISKALLEMALGCEDSKRDTIARAALCYIAALHFATLDYQTVIDLCSKVIMNQKSEEEEEDTLNGCCLLYIDDIAKIIGFYLIFRKITEPSLHHIERQIFLDMRLTPDVFAYYLTILSVERTSNAFGIRSIHPIPVFPLDQILMTITNRKSLKTLKKGCSVSCVYQRTELVDKLELLTGSYLSNKQDIIQLLMEYSLENMTSFYTAIFEEFGVECSTVDCYRAAYLYKCRKYPGVLHLCEQILNDSDLKTDLKELAVANVMVVPPLDNFFDRDIQCLLGLHTLACYLSPSNEYLIDDRLDEKCFFHFFARNFYLKEDSTTNPLSIVLSEHYLVKCHYFLRSRFLAQYLKVRCLIDCNHSLSEVIFEFNRLKARLPFEHFICCFMKKNY